MEVKHLLAAFEKAGKRTHIIGDTNAGLVAALDMEGRLFTVLDGEVLNRVNLEAITDESTRKRYLNPGGDGLWPAPEGTMYGYQYSTGGWSVPSSLRFARYVVDQCSEDSATISSEVDLINNQGVGVPTLFKRKIKVVSAMRSVEVTVEESITYVGRKTLSKTDFLLAPWTLCQFDCGPSCEVIFPCVEEALVWDLYEQKSDSSREFRKGFCHTMTDGSAHYQIGIDKEVPWIEYHDPRRGLIVRRQAHPLVKGQSYIDIKDASPDVIPSQKGVRYSVYSDSANFMEIEAVGGCPEIILPNTELVLSVHTSFLKT